jgi:hypothetical protein
MHSDRKRQRMRIPIINNLKMLLIDSQRSLNSIRMMKQVRVDIVIRIRIRIQRRMGTAMTITIMKMEEK